MVLVIGFLIGVECGWQECDYEDVWQIVGICIFSLVGLFGGFVILFVGELGSVVWVVLLLVFVVLVVVGYVSDVRCGGDQGMIIEIVLLMIFFFGSFVFIEQCLLVVVGGIVLILLLSFKDKFYVLLKCLIVEELLGIFKLLFIFVVLLLVLFNQGYGFWVFFNFYLIWWMVVLIVVFGFFVYLVICLIGLCKGLLLIVVFGGLVFFMVMILILVCLCECMFDVLLVCVLLVILVLMFLCIFVEIGVIYLVLLKELVLLFVVIIFVYFGGMLFYVLCGGCVSQEVFDELGLCNFFELFLVLCFVVLLSVILLLVEVGWWLFGDVGIYVVVLFFGFVDVDVIILFLVCVVQGEFDLGVVSCGIVFVVLSNSLVKVGLVVLVGGKWLVL